MFRLWKKPVFIAGLVAGLLAAGAFFLSWEGDGAKNALPGQGGNNGSTSEQLNAYVSRGPGSAPSLAGRFSTSFAEAAEHGGVAGWKGIEVTGEAAIKVKPDVVYISLGVQTQTATAGEAQTANASAMNKLIQALKGQGIAEDDMQTSGYSISPVYDYEKQSRGGQPELIGYMVQNSLQVKIKKIGSTGEIIDAAVKAGANTVHSISFGVENPTPVYRRALQEAYSDALERAQVIASRAGVSGLKVISVTELGGGVPVIQRMAKAEMAAADSSTPILAGENTIQASVRVVFGFGE
ncbi:MAG: SIMPL domain-containing protein [Firmicutes bacterium]|nr:SIMPL domain-containing protein [Bacillota bacterium]